MSRNPFSSHRRRTKNRIDAENAHPEARKIAHVRLLILRAYHKELSEGGKPKVQIMENFLHSFNSGMVLPEEYTKPDHLVRSTLYSWNKNYTEGGFAGLLPRYTWKARPGAVIVPTAPIPRYKEIVIPGPPKRKAKYEFLPCLSREWGGPPLACPIRLGLIYSMPVPKRTKMRRRMKMLKHRLSHIGSPNLDSLDSFIVGCLEGIVFRNHSQIVEFHSQKDYQWWPKTRILIRPLLR